VFPLRGGQTAVAIAQSTGIEEIRRDPTEFVRNIVLSYKKNKQGSSQAVMDIQKSSEAVMDMQGSRKTSMNMQGSRDADMDMQESSEGLENTIDSDDECDVDGDESDNVFNSYILKHHKGDRPTFVGELVNMQRTLGR